MSGDVTCPRCATKDRKFVCRELAIPVQRADILICSSAECKAMFQVKATGDLFDLTSTLEMIRLSDDLISATSPDTIAGESILHAVVMFESNLNTVKLGFLGKVRSMMQQLEGRAHFMHGELARRAMADGTLSELVATAKQIVDLVASQPDGIQRDVT